MERVIYCTECTEKMKGRYRNPERPYPGERIKYVLGKAMRAFVCDQCNRHIAGLTDCFAVSIWVEGGITPYSQLAGWEHSFVYVD